MANAIFTVMDGLGLLIVGYVLGRSDERKSAHGIAPQVIPSAQEGWKLVPIEPTQEMLDAADKGDREYTIRNFGDIPTFQQSPYDHYVAMLAAAPQGGDK